MSHHLRKFIEVWKHSTTSFRKKVYSMLLGLLILSGGVWAFALILSIKYPVLLGLITIAYGLGLRHSVDADHIAAIDNTTRKLLHEGKKPVGVGFFFSLGHSSVVILLSVIITLFSSFAQVHIPQLRTIGALIGTLISCFFLFGIGAVNAATLRELLHSRKEYTPATYHSHKHAHGGPFMRVFMPVFSRVSQSWHMFPVGFLFGLGFDTASEIALLTLSATTGVTGLPIAAVVLLPLAFTAGMALIDSLDGLLMLGAYGWAFVTPSKKLAYNITITAVSVAVAFGIGLLEVFQILVPKLGILSLLDLGGIGVFVIVVFAIFWIIFWGISMAKHTHLFSA